MKYYPQLALFVDVKKNEVLSVVDQCVFDRSSEITTDDVKKLLHGPMDISRHALAMHPQMYKTVRSWGDEVYNEATQEHTIGGGRSGLPKIAIHVSIAIPKNVLYLGEVVKDALGN